MLDDDEVFQRLQGLQNRSNADEAGAVLYDEVDKALGEGQFARVDSWMAAVDVDALPLLLAVGWLTITGAARDVLPARAALYERVEKRLERELPDRKDQILVGLK